MGIDIKKYIIRFLLIVGISSVIGLIFITLSWIIPGSQLNDNIQYGIEILQKEGSFFTDGSPDFEYLFTHAWGARVDGGNDYLIFKRALTYVDEKNVLYNALYVDGDIRYWNGYMILLRPLFAVATYAQARYIFMIALFVMLWVILKKTSERLGNGFSIAFLIAMLVTNIIIIPYNFIHSLGTIIYFGSIIFVLYKYSNKTKCIDIFTSFGFFAILNLYFDRITVLAQSLGFPLLFILLLEHIQYNNSSFRHSMKIIAAAVSGWISMFLGFWIIKWGITTVVTGINVFENAANRASQYADASNPLYIGYRQGRLWCIEKNLAALLPSKGEALPFVFAVFAIILCIAVIILVKNRNYFTFLGYYKRFITEIVIMFGLPLFLYLAAPYMSTSNATAFAYRYQALWIFGILGLYFNLISGFRNKGV